MEGIYSLVCRKRYPIRKELSVIPVTRKGDERSLSFNCEQK